ncbi:MAG: DNA polymerase I [Fimbriimonas sp.]
MHSKRLVVIDGYSLLYRAFYATRYLSTTDGRPTNALHGFVSMLFILLEKIRPEAMVVALDAPGKTFRHADYEAYKGTRKETADELRVQLVGARELIQALGIPTVEVVGFEADDVVGTISKSATDHGYNTTIVTGDLDALQLVDEHVSVLTLKTGVTDTVTYDRAAVIARYGFGPEHVPDFKALKGDTSDNIPGVPGIGDKGAADLISKFGTVEEMLARFDEVEPKYQKKISGNEAQMLLSKKLATIVRDVQIDYAFPAFVLNDEQLKTATAMMESYEFKSHVRRAAQVLGPYVIGSAMAEPAKSAFVNEEKLEPRVRSMATFEELDAWVRERPFALTFAEGPPSDDMFADPVRQGLVAIGLDVVEVDETFALALLRQAPDRAILHDAKPLFKRQNMTTSTPYFDTMLAGAVLQAGRAGYALKDLAQGYLDVVPPANPAELVASISLLADALKDRLVKEGQFEVFRDIEMPLIPILAEMETLGIRTSRERLQVFSKELSIEIDKQTKRVYELAGQEFTIGSPKQLGEILFEKLGIPGATKTKTGYATGVEILSQIAPQYEIAQAVLDWRELSKLKSTYADALQHQIRPDGRIHTTYSQTGAATGRLSSNDPNLQNIPIRTELGRSIRKAFVAEDGYRLLSCDYSQIELRVLAHMCEEPALMEAFQSGEDVHSVTATRMFHLGDEKPSKEQRRLAKMLNYAVLYGVTDFGLAQQLGSGFSRSEAKELIATYNERFPGIKEFTKGVVGEARSKGFTTTLCGRRRYFPDIHAQRVVERQYAERQAMNAPIQGTAADMLKLAMIQVHRNLQGSSTRMLLNVHDELVFEVPLGDEAVVETLRTDMEQSLPLKVPVDVDAKIGVDWAEMTAI